MRRALVALLMLTFLLPSALLAKGPAVSPSPVELRLAALAGGPRCEAPSLFAGQVSGSAELKDFEIIGDLCSGLCIISCLAQGYFGGFCVGLTCHCNGAESQ